MMRAPESGRTGLTLVELMMGMGLMTAVLFLFALAEYTARRSSTQALCRLDVQRDMARTVHYLRQDLHGALVSTPGGEGTLLTLELPGQSPVGDPLPSHRDQVTYTTSAGEHGGTELWRTVRPQKGSHRNAVRMLLTRGLDTLEFQALHEARSTGARIQLSGSLGFGTGDGQMTLELVVPRRPAARKRSGR